MWLLLFNSGGESNITLSWTVFAGAAVLKCQRGDLFLCAEMATINPSREIPWYGMWRMKNHADPAQ
jgi:hypothetical protein